MKLILILGFFLSSNARAVDCDLAQKYLQKEALRLEFKSVKKLCRYLDEIGMESEMFRAVTACRAILAGLCPDQIDQAQGFQ